MDNINKANMSERYCALSLGIIFLIIGIAGFIPAFVSMPPAVNAAQMPVDTAPNTYAAGFGYLFGLFPVNLLHNIVHCIVGILGIVFSGDVARARLFNRGFAISYALLALMGLLPITGTTFGLMPIFGNNVWFNAITAAVAAYFGFIVPNQTMAQMNTSSRS